jgi:hypothetical protein
MQLPSINRHAKFFVAFLAVAVALSQSQPASGLTIYRLGGENQPPPQIDGVSFDFVQLPWAAIEADRHGVADFVTITPDSLGPLRFDPQVNLAPILADFGGGVTVKTWAGWTTPTPEDRWAYDADSLTVFLGDDNISREDNDPEQKNYLFNFGTRIVVDRIRLFPRARFAEERFIEHLIIATRDEDPLKVGTRDFTVGPCSVTCDLFDFDLIHELQENTNSTIELALPEEPISQLLFHGFKNTRGIWELAELQIFADGYVPFSSYVSNVIDLQEPSSLGDLTWFGREDDEARIDLSARFGVDDDPNTYWRFTFSGDEQSRFDSRGEELTLSTYRSLPFLQRARVTHDTAHWEFWSAPFEFAAGEAFLEAPGARQYLQIKGDIRSSGQAGARLDYLQFAVTTPPVVSDVVAEIVPALTAPGSTTSFTLLLRPDVASGDRGFDAIEVFTPNRPVSVDAVRLSGVDVGVDTLRVDESGFAVRIPRIDVQRTGELIEVDFRASVFRFSTRFTGRVFDSSQPHEVHQSVRAGDADELVEGNGLEVRLDALTQDTILALRLPSTVFTPNADGVNDRLMIEYDLLNLTDAVPVRLDLYDLAGQRLGSIFQGQQLNGRFPVEWDGMIGGRVPAPGLYVLRLEVDTDTGTDTAHRTLSIVY